MTTFWENDTPVETNFWSGDQPAPEQFWAKDAPVSGDVMDMTVSQGLDKFMGSVEDVVTPENPDAVSTLPAVGVGTTETLASAGTGWLSKIPAGIKGTADLLGVLAGQIALDKDIDLQEATAIARKTIEGIQEENTYSPRTRMGELQGEVASEGMSTMFHHAGKGMEEAYGVNPIISEAALEAGMDLLPFSRTIGKGVKRVGDQVKHVDDVLRNKVVSDEIVANNLAVEQAKMQGRTIGKPSGKPDPFMAETIAPETVTVPSPISTPTVFLNPSRAGERLDGVNKSHDVPEGIVPKTSGGVKVHDVIDRYKERIALDPSRPLLSRVFNEVIDTPYLRVEQQFPNSTLGLELRRVDADVGFKKTEYDHIVNRFDDLEKVFTKAELDTYKKHWLRQEMSEVRKMTEQKLGTNEAKLLWEQYDEAMRLRFEELKQTGLKIEAIPEYLPRFVTDMDKFNKLIPSTHQQKFFNLQRKYKKGDITSAEYSNQLNRLLTGGADPFVSPASTRHAKARTAEQARHYDAYANPADTLRTYFNETGTTIAERRFLGKGDTTDKAISSKLEQEVNSGKITLAQAEELRNVLSARFGAQVHHAPKAIVGAVKDIGYLTTIGQVGSAVLQFADMIAAFAKYPTTAVPAALKSALPRSIRRALKDKLDVIEPLDVGIGDIMQELSGKPSLSMKALDTVLKTTGFKMVDRFGKRVIINSARNRFKKMASSKAGQQRLANMGYKNLMDKAGKGEWEQFLKDLQTGNMKNDNVRFAVVNAVAEVQPIFLADMPMMYLKHPNGRIMYSLKTWALRFINRLREDIMKGNRSIKSGKVKEGLFDYYGKAITYAGAVFLATNSIDFSKMALHSLWHGKDLRIEDMTNKAFNNLTMMFTMTNRYDWSIGYGKKPTDLVTNKLAPPAFSFFNSVVNDALSWDDWDVEDYFKKGKSGAYIPVGGRAFKDAAKPPKKQDFFWED